MDKNEDKAKKYLTDIWTLDDSLGLGQAGDQIARMVLEVETPFTLGVTGKWGSGKTSVMRRAFVTLGGQPIKQSRMFSEPGEEENHKDNWSAWSLIKDDKINEDRPEPLSWGNDYHEIVQDSLCIWYSPWQHQNTDNPLIPLLREIQAQFSMVMQAKQKVGNFNRRGGLAAAKLLEHVIDAAATFYAGKNISVAKGVTDAMRKGWNEAETDLTTLSDGQRFHLLFEDAVNELIKINKKDNEEANAQSRLIIFIDDLDRCEEATIIHLLEAIKLYLSCSRCVFVLGLDDDAVMAAMKNHWEHRSEEANREYLEKLFQAMLTVPLPNNQEVRKMIQQQLTVHEFKDVDELAEKIEQLLEPNPRKIKNFLNSLCATWALYDLKIWVTKQGLTEAKRFIIFQYLRLYHRPVWRLLERQPWSLHLLWFVLTSADPSQLDASQLPASDTDQRMLREIFYRTFCHVLKNTSEVIKQHGEESLDEVVKKFQQRQDRKRSDECLCALFTSVFNPNDGELLSVNDRYLSIVVNSEGQT